MSLVFLDSQGYQAFLVFPVGQVDLDSTGGEKTIDEAALVWRMMGLSRVFDNGKAIISESCFFRMKINSQWKTASRKLI